MRPHPTTTKTTISTTTTTTSRWYARARTPAILTRPALTPVSGASAFVDGPPRMLQSAQVAKGLSKGKGASAAAANDVKPKKKRGSKTAEYVMQQARSGLQTESVWFPLTWLRQRPVMARTRRMQDEDQGRGRRRRGRGGGGGAVQMVGEHG